MSRKYIQPQRFQTHQNKDEAILLVEQYVNEHIAEFKDGEEITIEHKDAQGEQMYSTAIIKKSGNTAKVYASVESNETLRIVESEEEPKDRGVLWLTEDESPEEESGNTRNLKEEIDSLKLTIKKLQEIINRHDYALSSTIAGGDIITNSEKYELENMAEPEAPEGVEGDTYAETDTVVTSFDLYIGKSTLGVYNKLYKGQKYYLKLKMFNNASEVVREAGETLTIECTPSEIATVDSNRVLYATTAGTIQIVATLYTKEGERLRNVYPLTVEYNEEPDYKTYSEPNVKHFVLKTVENTTILRENSDYLCINEPVWCISENALYIKAKTSNGLIRLFKISGGGGSIDPIDPDTGSTSGDTTAVTSETIFLVDDSGLTMTSTDVNAIYVDENGILNINVGTVDSNGILILNDTVVTGSTSGDTSGSTSGDTSDTTTGVVDGNGSLNVFGTASVENGVLIMNGSHVNVNNNGILEITS